MAYDFEHANIKQKESLLRSLTMYELTKKESFRRMSEELNSDGTKRYSEGDIQKTQEDISRALDAVVDQFYALGGTEEEINEYLNSKEHTEAEERVKPKAKNKINVSLEDLTSFDDNFDILGEIEKKEKEKEEKRKSKPKAVKTTTKKKKETVISEEVESDMDAEDVVLDDKLKFIPKTYNYDPSAEMDLVPLPSKGECYGDEIGDSIAVMPLNATDENIIVSPNLFRQNKVIDVLLRRKIVGDINPSHLTEGDRDAIVLWLRATGYGNEYPLVATDNSTGKEFNVTADLSTLNFKKFNLKSDGEGHFEFTLPTSKDVVKFKFLTHEDNEKINKVEKYNDNLIMKGEILTMSKTIDTFLANNDDLSEETRDNFREASDKLNEGYETFDLSGARAFSDLLTQRLRMCIYSINGETDRNYINSYVSTMPAKDSLALRKYISKNEPGVDFHFVVERPESLGGGSQDVFLSVNQFVLLNVPE